MNDPLLRMNYNQCVAKDIRVPTMTTKRSMAASVVISNNSLWITGGQDESHYVLSSSEYIETIKRMSGPDLPIAVSSHSMVNIKNDLTIIIGGEITGGFSSSKTFYYNHKHGNWSDGPELFLARALNAAGIVTDEATQEKLLFVTGGQTINNTFKSTEVLIGHNWELGIK